jgi:hypothetical protein
MASSQDFFLFIRIQIFDIHAAAIRTKKLSLAAAVITGNIQLGSRPPPAAFQTFFLVLAHTPRFETPHTREAVQNPCFHAPSLRVINLQAISKIADYAQEQGKSRRKSAAYI